MSVAAQVVGRVTRVRLPNADEALPYGNGKFLTVGSAIS